MVSIFIIIFSKTLEVYSKVYFNFTKFYFNFMPKIFVYYLKLKEDSINYHEIVF